MAAPNNQTFPGFTATPGQDVQPHASSIDANMPGFHDESGNLCPTYFHPPPPPWYTSMMTILVDIQKRLKECVTREELIQLLPRARNLNGAMAGQLKPKNAHTARSFVVKHPHIEDIDTLIYYHNSAQIALQILIHITIHVWEYNLGAKTSWLGEAIKRNLDADFLQYGIDAGHISGLALILFSASGPGMPKDPFAKTHLGKVHVFMASRVVLKIFQDTRRNLFGRFDPTISPDGDVTRPKHDGILRPPPRYMTEELALLIASSETEFTHRIVENLCINGRAPHGHPILDGPGKGVKRARASDSHVHHHHPSAGDVDSGTELTSRDKEALEHRCAPIKHYKQEYMYQYRTNRNSFHRMGYRLLLCYVRQIQNAILRQDTLSDIGFWIEWGKDQDTDDTAPASELLDPSNWKIEDTKTDDSADSELYNNNLYKKLLEQFTCMKVLVHYRRQVKRPLATPAGKFAEYEKLASKAPNAVLTADFADEVSFYQVALKSLQNLYGHAGRTPLSALLKTSRHSLRALHILAMGIRGTTIFACGKANTESEIAAWRAVTTSENVEPSGTVARVPIMMSAKLKEGNSSGTSDDNPDNQSRNAIDERKLKMSFDAWLVERRTRGCPLDSTHLPFTGKQKSKGSTSSTTQEASARVATRESTNTTMGAPNTIAARDATYESISRRNPVRSGPPSVPTANRHYEWT